MMSRIPTKLGSVAGAIMNCMSRIIRGETDWFGLR